MDNETTGGMIASTSGASANEYTTLEYQTSSPGHVSTSTSEDDDAYSVQSEDDKREEDGDYAKSGSETEEEDEEDGFISSSSSDEWNEEDLSLSGSSDGHSYHSVESDHEK